MQKYPRTPHVPWSECITDDDLVGYTEDMISLLVGKSVIVTEKMDGECTSLYRHGKHFRSIDSGSVTPEHAKSRSMINILWATIRYYIDKDQRICGENLQATHSIKYNGLKSCFMAFSVWENNTCLSWQNTIRVLSNISKQSGVTLYSVPVKYSGRLESIEHAVKLTTEFDRDKSEGTVIRNAGPFHYNDFGRNVFKFVRKDHVKTDKHWAHKTINYNGIIGT